MNQNRLIDIWRTAANDLGITIVAPFSLKTTSGKIIEADLLVNNFGSSKGMIIVKRYESISQYTKEIAEMGYGFSVMDEPGVDENYDKDCFIEILTDWGWNGEQSKRPF